MLNWAEGNASRLLLNNEHLLPSHAIPFIDILFSPHTHTHQSPNIRTSTLFNNCSFIVYGLWQQRWKWCAKIGRGAINTNTICKIDWGQWVVAMFHDQDQPQSSHTQSVCSMLYAWCLSENHRCEKRTLSCHINENLIWCSCIHKYVCVWQNVHMLPGCLPACLAVSLTKYSICDVTFDQFLVSVPQADSPQFHQPVWAISIYDVMYIYIHKWINIYIFIYISKSSHITKWTYGSLYTFMYINPKQFAFHWHFHQHEQLRNYVHTLLLVLHGIVLSLSLLF